jgi:hypothetical protein
MITLKSDYRKTLGLPGYSSHSFSASVEVELSAADDIPAEIHRLYQTLQQNVDQQIQDPGYVPEGTYGMDVAKSPPQKPVAAPAVRSAQPSRTNQPARQSPAAAKSYGARTAPASQVWNCSEKQRQLIDKLIRESDITKKAVDAVAQDRFGKVVPALNKLEASGLIDMMINQPDVFEFQPGLQS